MAFFDFLKKASATTRGIVLLAGGQPVYTPKKYDKLTEASYGNNVWAYVCVNEIGRSIGGIPWTLYQGALSGKGKRAEVETHPLLDLLARPNPSQGRASFFEAVSGYLMLSGNSYIESVDLGGRPVELWPLRPDRVIVVPDAKIGVGAYRYTVGNTVIDFTPQQVLHMPLFNPLNDWYGMSPIENAARLLDRDNAGGDYQTALLQNSARPSGALLTDSELTDKEYRRVKRQIQEQYQGVANAGRPLVLDGGLKWQQIGLSPNDVSILESSKWNASQICAVFGVPAEIVGLVEATYQNRKEAKKAFYTETVLPLMDRIRDHLNTWLVPRFGANLYLDYDASGVEALQEDTEKLWTRIAGADWLSVNEKRQLCGMDTVPEGDVILVPATSLPLGQAVEPAPTPAPAPGKPPEEEPPEPEPPAPEDDAPKALPSKPEFKAFNLRSPEAKLAQWKVVDRLRTAWEQKAAVMLRNRFASERLSVVHAIRSGEEPDWDGQEVLWKQTYHVLYRAVAEDFGERVSQSLKSEAPTIETKSFNLNEVARKLINEIVGQQVKTVLQSSKDRIREEVLKGLEDDEDFPTIAKRIDDLYLKQTIPNRSMVIARTEVLTASSIGSRTAADEVPLKKEHEWVATPDHRCRDAHRTADGQRVPFDEPYRVGGAKMLFPGDPKGGAKNVIQCRCVEIFHLLDDQEEDE